MSITPTPASSAARRAFLRLCWLPAATWLVSWLYIRRYDGWGAWAAAPVLLPALVLSITMGIAGLSLLLAGLRQTGRLDGALLLATLLAASVVILLWLRYLLA